MSYIPDCREDSNYNFKNLTETDKEFVRGYDWNTEQAVDNFFDNIENLFDEDSHLMHTLREELPERMKDEYVMEFSYIDHTEHRKIETYLDLLRFEMLSYLESERNEVIVSCIDGYMGEE